MTARLLFVHIAKTGGSSLRRILKTTPEINTFDCIHNNSLLRFCNGKRIKRCELIASELMHYDVAVLMMRHPLDRFLSCYRYFLSGGLNQRAKGSFPSDLEIQDFLVKRAPSLLDCARNLPEIAQRIPHFRPASFWLDALPNPLADLVFTGRQESFDADLKRMMRLLGVKDFSGVDVLCNTSPSMEDDPWNPESRYLVSNFYGLDFKRFGYCLPNQNARVIVQYWDETVPPALFVQRMEDWRRMNPDWAYKLFDQGSAAAFIGENYGELLREAFLDIRFAAMQADVFRIAYVLACGGLWIDAATVCLNTLTEWLDESASLLLLRRAHQDHPKVWNGVIYACNPGHPLLQKAWNEISARLLAREGESVYRDFGPGVLRELLAKGTFDHDLSSQSMRVLSVVDVSAHLQPGSSAVVMRHDQHWSQRQKTEPLYLSGGSPSASH